MKFNDDILIFFTNNKIVEGKIWTSLQVVIKNERRDSTTTKLLENMEERMKRRTLGEYIENKNYYVPILYDASFKEVFANEDYPHLPAYLISVFLDLPYEEMKDQIQFLGKGMKGEQQKGKKGRKDAVFKITIASCSFAVRKINLEANLTRSKVDSRIFRNFYWYENLAGHGLEEKKGYEEVVPTIQINFNDFYLNTKSKEIIDVLHVKDKANTVYYPEIFTIFHINVEKMMQMWYNGDVERMEDNEKEKYRLGALLLISYKKDFKKCLEELKAPIEVKRDIGRIMKRMNEDYCFERPDPEKDWEMILRREVKIEKEKALEKGLEKGKNIGKILGLEEGKTIGLEEGRTIGLKEGRKNAILETAMLLLENGAEVELVAKSTNLPLKQVKSLKKSLAKQKKDSI